MTVSYFDPINPEIIYDSRRTIVLAIADEEKRKFAIDFFNTHHADVLDVYRDPEMLIPKILDYCCFMRLLDYETYVLIEEKMKEYVKDEDPTTLTPTIVYGTRGHSLIENPAIIDGYRTLPEMLAGYFSLLIRKN